MFRIGGLRSAILAPLLVLAEASSLSAQPAPTPNPYAAALFAGDNVLRDWALHFYDRNGDGWLTLFEAQEAALAFKKMADIDRDGRVSVSEFGSAREFVRVRW